MRVRGVFAMMAGLGAASCSLVFSVDGFDDHLGSTETDGAPLDAAASDASVFEGSTADGPEDAATFCALPPVREGLLAHYAFDRVEDGGFASCLGTSSPYERLDSDGGAPTVVPGRSGSAFHGGACLVARSGLLLSPPFTIAGWVKPQSTGSIVSQTRGSIANQGGWKLEMSDMATLRFTFAQALGAENVIRATTNFVPVEPTHVAVTLDPGRKAILYVSGAEQQASSGNGFKGDTSSTFAVGCTTNRDEIFAGILDELSVYERALSPTEIATLAAWPTK